jgi:glycosyltransferase involved in cell wall biosynthesis
MKISVITPTHGRERFLPALYRCFADQAYSDRELLIHDDSPAASAFFSSLRDPRVRYFHSPDRLSVGEKRNFLLQHAQGELVAFFDDDDYYGPTYLAVMAGRLGDADMVKLTGWFALSVPDDALFYWDTSANHPLHYKVGEGPVAFVTSTQFKPDFVARNSDGYGFSYLFRRSACGTARFPDKNFGEDFVFLGELRAAGRRVAHLDDDQGLCVHILHNRNTSVIFPQYRLPALLAPRLFPGLAAYLASVKT